MTHLQSRVANRMRMRQVLLMLSIDDGHTLSSAAEKIGMSQPAASKMLRELESALGQSLFDRNKRNLVLTPAGRLTMDAFHDMRLALHMLEERLSCLLLLERPGSLTLGVAEPELPCRISAAIASARRHHPEYAFSFKNLHHQQLLRPLIDGKVDAVLGWSFSCTGSDAAQLQFTAALGPVEFAAIVHAEHHLAKRTRGQTHGPLHATALAAWPWILPSHEYPSHHILRACLSETERELPESTLEATTLSDALRLSSGSHAVVLWPIHMLEKTGKQGPWASLPLTEKSSAEWGIWTSTARPTKPPLAALLEHTVPFRRSASHPATRLSQSSPSAP